MIIRSDPASPVTPQNLGSRVTLTCTVEIIFPENYTLPVIVTTVYTGPYGFFTTNTAQPVMGSNATYTSTAMVSLFGRDQSGKYTCSSNVSSMNILLSASDSVSNFTRVSVGKAYNFCTQSQVETKKSQIHAYLQVHIYHIKV